MVIKKEIKEYVEIFWYRYNKAEFNFELTKLLKGAEVLRTELEKEFDRIRKYTNEKNKEECYILLDWLAGQISKVDSLIVK